MNTKLLLLGALGAAAYYFYSKNSGPKASTLIIADDGTSFTYGQVMQLGNNVISFNNTRYNLVADTNGNYYAVTA